ncbi:PREDICTED: transcription factor bHLH18-like isoform X2 [Lupinus angustifolius]|uniref:transcription factor bHLH18-like isoform X2 n=1 Tax=Lupinus angustifolius TaxID=3871 RepID=UPI00092E582A|nr:PREDICTED: transcription factor bHLH18-like isoform X2 [Lupinus angustifolius]
MTSIEEESWTSWLCDLDAEDYSFINESDTNMVEGSFPSPNNDVVPTIQEENSESQLSYATFNTENSSTMSNWDDNSSNFERPAKVMKISTTSNTGYFSQKDSTPSSYILSFDNVNPEPIFLSTDPNLKPKAKVVNEPKRNIIQEGRKKCVSVNRSPHHAQDHIIAERMRRERISHQFIALSALIPGLKKTDKATVLADAIKHVKELQEQVKVLEDQAKRKRVESVIYVEKSKVSSSEDVSDTSSNSGDGNSDDPSSKTTRSLPEIEARVSEKNVLIRIHCEKQKGILVNILKEIEKLHLSVINSSALPFGTSIMDITIIAEMDGDFSMSVKELARSLRMGLLKFSSS